MTILHGVNSPWCCYLYDVNRLWRCRDILMLLYHVTFTVDMPTIQRRASYSMTLGVVLTGLLFSDVMNNVDMRVILFAMSAVNKQAILWRCVLLWQADYSVTLCVTWLTSWLFRDVMFDVDKSTILWCYVWRWQTILCRYVWRWQADH